MKEVKVLFGSLQFLPLNCCSDGFFFAVKEVSLLDSGSQGQQSVYQLEQVRKNMMFCFSEN